MWWLIDNQLLTLLSGQKIHVHELTNLLTTKSAEIRVPVSPKALPTSTFEFDPSDDTTDKDIQNRHMELPTT